jgi:hypothetical protein
MIMRSVFVLFGMMLTTAVMAAEQATVQWPSVSKNQSRSSLTLKIPVAKRDVTTNICQDLCYCTEDPKVTKVTNAVCIQEDDKFVCTSYLFYDCAKRTVNGRETCRTCI